MSKAAQDSVLQVRDLNVSFDTPDGQVDAVRGVNLHINRGECLGIVGESGSGKSQTFMTAMGLLANNVRATGDVSFHGKSILGMPLQQLNKIRGRYMSMIFQDPLTSLTPHMTVLDQMMAVLELHTDVRGDAAAKKSLEWLERVQISDAKRRLDQYPHELSGGMRQRVMIAMSMLCEPELLIADEPTTALDVTVQAEILDLLDQLKKESNTAIALITHDMGVVARMCDRIR